MNMVRRVSAGVYGLFRLQYGNESLSEAYVLVRRRQAPLRWILRDGEIHWANCNENEIINALLEGAGI